MHRVTSLFASAALAIILSGCGAQPDSGSSSSSSTSSSGSSTSSSSSSSSSSSGTALGAIVAAINVGSSASTTYNGVTYSADQHSLGGAQNQTADTISGAAGSELFNSERYGSFTYNIPVPNGNYQVTLHLAELYWEAPGERSMSAVVEDQVALEDFDTYQTAGHDTAYTTEPVTVTVSDGLLTITASATSDNAALAGILVRETTQTPEIEAPVYDGSPMWLGTWGTAPYVVDANNSPPTPGLKGNTLRQNFKVSVGGREVRMRFTNIYSDDPITLNAVHLAKQSASGGIQTQTDTPLTFGGSGSVTIPAGEAVYSDAVSFDLSALDILAVSIHFGATPRQLTGHGASRTTSYLANNNVVSSADLSNSTRTDSWYVIERLEVRAPNTGGAVAILGDSITDGRGSGTSQHNRWPDELAKRLQASPNHRDVGILNMGIGASCLIREGCPNGEPGIVRARRDVFDQQGLRWLIVAIGVNDIDATGTDEIADNVINGYNQLINRAHVEGIKVLGATITPINGSFYDSAGSEAARTKVNNWIRNSGQFDGVIDLEQAISNGSSPPRVQNTLHDGDLLHPNEEGYRIMAGAVDLGLFNH